MFDLQWPNAGLPSACVMISVGAACEVPRPNRDRARALRVAYKAVYVAKPAGRNRVVPAWSATAPLGGGQQDSSVVPG